MKALLGFAIAVAVSLPPLASAQGLAASVKDRNASATIESMPAEPGTLPLRSGRSAYKKGSASVNAATSGTDTSSQICTNCDD